MSCKYDTWSNHTSLRGTFPKCRCVWLVQSTLCILQFLNRRGSLGMYRTMAVGLWLLPLRRVTSVPPSASRKGDTVLCRLCELSAGELLWIA
jgi:hypothetical protein